MLKGAYASLCALAITLAASGQEPDPLFAPTDVDASIPSPASVLGHPIGERAAGYESVIGYLRELVEASDLVTMTPYARSHEGRALYYLTITSADNHDRIDEIKADNAKLADPRGLADAQEADRIIAGMPGVAWLAYSIHGDELSSSDAAMQVAYLLAAGTDDATRTLRDEMVIHIDPLMNPDGRQRYLGQLQTLTGKVPNPDYQSMPHRGLWSAGRGNHYLFDMNRDWLPQTQPETRGRAAVILSWHPHLIVDSHEMGGMDTYLFDPPREPINVNLSDSNLAWRRRFSADQAAAFDRHGWSYYTQEWYEEWYPGYTNAWGGLLGAIGILYEQAGVNAALVKQATGATLTYREAVAHHVVSSLANLRTLGTNRARILEDFLAERQWALVAEPLERAFILPPSPDRAKRGRFLELLRLQGFEFSITDDAVTATDVVNIWAEPAAEMTFPRGTVIVRSAQPQRRLLEALLEFDPHMPESFLEEERKELERYRGSRIYDATAWNLPMAYGLDAYWAREVAAAAAPPDEPPPPAPAGGDGGPGYGWLIDGRGADIHHALARLFEGDCKPRAATKPFTFDGVRYERGAILLRRHENPPGLEGVLGKLSGELDLDIRPVSGALSNDGPDLGGRRFHLLQRPQVAIASQWPIATSSFGSTWFLLDDRLRMRCSPVNVQSLRSIDLRKYNVLVLPRVWSTDALAAVINEGVVKRIKAWVEDGGTLIAYGGSAAFVAREETGLGTVRLKRDVLDELAVYEEALQRERKARKIEIDPEEIWGGPAAVEPDPDEPASEVSEPKLDTDALRRLDRWQRRFHPTGVIMAADLDPEHWLC
ncbi:MAG: M14 family metallopeptidase, partial [Planctomycetota bacterium]